MSKSFGPSGFVIFSDDIEYEFAILRRYFLSDLFVENIVFVYSMKNDISGVFSGGLLEFNKKLVIVPFEEYNKIEYASAVESLDLSKTVMIIKDLHFMLKRLDERLSMMQIKHSCYKKIVIDEVLFMVDMWKIYFPYSFFDKTLLGYSHSYAFEAAVRNYENDKSLPDPYDPAVLAGKIKGSTFINYSRYFLFNLGVEEYKVNAEELAGYERLKNKLFESETSIKRIIAKLHEYSSSLVFGHNLPLNLSRVYRWKDLKDVMILKTDLKVDNYLYSEMVKLIEGTNTLASLLHGD
jgi:hypothetical protein